jgi:glycerol kinase
MILAIDQGTTGTTCLVVDDELKPRGRGYQEIGQHFPEPGWVEHDLEEIWASVGIAAGAALADAGIGAGDLQAIGIANQRETTAVWERRSGRPVHRAIVWQDRRTAERCRLLPAELIRARTGLVPDPYFSATKLEWILEHGQLATTELAFGTIDSWLVWRLTGGHVHVTDVTNAARTMLLGLDALDWDDELLELFHLDPALLPRVAASSEVVGEANLLGATVPIAGIAGDQQAALFGQACFAPWQAKATYGTGTFVLVNVGESREPAPAGLLETVAAVGPGMQPQYALEGAVLVSGAAIQWLRDGLELVTSAEELERLAASVDSTGGVTFVPALTGLGAPYWEPQALGVISGLSRGTTKAELARAALEAIAHQVADVVEVLPGRLAVLRADGGAAANEFLMQFQADLLDCPVEIAAEQEATALGAAALAGLAVGVWRDVHELEPLVERGARFEPTMSKAEIERRRDEWRKAIRRALVD